MRTRHVLSVALVTGLLTTAPVVAQSAPAGGGGRVLSSAGMDAALAGHESSVDKQRAGLFRFLSRPQVRELAQDRGIDMGRVESAAAGLSDEQVRDLAPLMAEADAIQEGGLGTVTISVVAIIIILLVLILVT